MENDLTYVRQGTTVENLVGWQDYNDLATQTTPLSMTLADTWYPLPNDGLGPFTDTSERVLRKPDIWNPQTNTFNFAGLEIGTVLFARFSYYITCPSSNTEVEDRMSMAQGSGIDYTLPISFDYFKKGNRRYHTAITAMFTIDNPETRDFPAQIEIMADVGGCEVEVEGWKITTFNRY